ncbi:MAG TPA: STAS domain-containing protein [Planctomycetaceae bacterium]|nr:STAS domain-containing protein [Planctomycetaceae bacterium]
MALTDFQPAYFRVREDGEVVITAIVVPQLTEEENIEQMGQEFFTLVDQYECRRLVVDLSHVEYATSAALGKLITLHRRLHRHDGKLVLCGVRGALAEILATSRLLDYFHVADDADGAAAQLRADNAPPRDTV